MLVELSVVEQRYQAVLAVIRDGVPIVQVARRFDVSRQAVHRWLRWYEAQGLAGLADRSHRPPRCAHQMDAAVEVWVLEARRRNPDWGPRRLVHEAARAGVEPAPSRSGVYRALRRAGLIDPEARRRRDRRFRRWERGGPTELWQLDVVGGVLLADGREAKILTGIDDHSRFCVCSGLMLRATSRAVCRHFAQALSSHGVPQEILTDNGKVFTGRFAARDVEVLFDRICRENGIDHLLTAPRRPQTTGKIERFHRTLRSEFLTGRIFGSLAEAQAELDRWVGSYNAERPHSALDMATPGQPVRPGRAGTTGRRLGPRPGALRWGLDLSEDHDERRDLRRLAGDQLRQAPGRPDGRHPPRGSHDADLGRSGPDQDRPEDEREGGEEAAGRASELKTTMMTDEL
jgi:transposase InsO family protein